MAISGIFGAVIPCYNSARSVVEVIERTEKAIEGMGFIPRVICVNDGSVDTTLEVLRERVIKDKYLTVLDLGKNFGQHNALLAGIQNIGEVDYVAGLDDDLQTPPEELSKLYKQLNNKDADICFGLPDSCQYERYREIGSRFNRWCSHVLTCRPKDSITSSFWLIRGYVAASLLDRNDPHPQIQSLFFEVTTRFTDCIVEHDARRYGKSGYTIKKLVRQWGRLSNYSEAVLAALWKTCLFFAGASSLIVIAVAVLDPQNVPFVLEAAFYIIEIVVLIALSGMISYLNKTFEVTRGARPYTVRARYKLEKVEGNYNE